MRARDCDDENPTSRPRDDRACRMSDANERDAFMDDDAVARVVRSSAFAALEAGAKSCGASTANGVLRAPAVDASDIDAVRALAHEALHVGNWCDARVEWRGVYAAATLMWVCKGGAKTRAEATRALDVALMLGGPVFEEELHRVIARVREYNGASMVGAPVAKRTKRSGVMWDASSRETAADDTVARRRDVSLEAFYRDYMAKSAASTNGERCVDDHGTPVVLQGAVSHWPAIEKWRDGGYVVEQIGDRTVPIEVGETYVHDAWSQKLMAVRDFIDEYIDNVGEHSRDDSTKNVAYLAQHELFEQCPDLKRDIEEPMYCVLGTGSVCAVNAWFGPANTVSPAHTDPHHNLLCQVVGAKRVRLFAPSETSRMYPHDERKMANTSRVDVMHPNLEEFPEFASASYVDATLFPGDALYIPPGWWHHVRALDVSFSVSYWWD